MKNLVGLALTTTLALTFGAIEAVHAQSAIDPSSALLLNGGSNTNRVRNNEPRLDSGRYTVRPRAQTEKAPSERTSVDKTTRKNTETVQAPSPTPAPNAVVSEPTTPLAPPTPTPVVLEPDSEGHVVVSDTPSQVSSGELSTRRLLDISIGSAYLYQDSESAYSLRRSTMSAPGYGVDAKVWFSPEFAVGGRYFSTLGGNISGGGGDLATNLTDTAFGIYLRRPFTNSNLTFGFEFVESNFDVSDSALGKLKAKSTGFRLAIEGEFATSESGAWLVGFSASPKLQHEEGSTATHAQSGKGVSAYAIGASVERRWKFDDANALFVRVQHRIERDLFTGTVTAADPVGGATPSGVSVTVGTTLIQFGYNWGN